MARFLENSPMPWGPRAGDPAVEFYENEKAVVVQ